MSNRQLELLICDCDGVLVDTEHLVSLQLNRALQVLYPSMDVSSVMTEGFGKQIEDILKTIERRFDVCLPKNFCADLNNQINSSLLSSDISIPGVKRALESIEAPLAIVSNSHTDRLLISIKSVGLEARVGDNVFSADLVEKPKPHPDIYRFAAQHMGVDCSNCMVIEDSLSGVTAAKAAGMRVWGYVGGSHIPKGHVKALVDLGVCGVFSNMDDLPEIVRRNIKSI